MTKTLTGNDLALAAFACGHAINWCKQQGRSQFWKKEIAKYTDLSRKLQAISDTAHPLTTNDEGAVLEFGGEEIMRLDREVVSTLQKRLRRDGAVS